MENNIILKTDSYKISHHLQYPPNTTYIFSYFESRGGKFEKCLFFGLQYILKKWLAGPVVTLEAVNKAESFFEKHFPKECGKLFNRAGWERIVNHHGGMLPLRIKAVREGTVLPVKNVLFTVESTDTELPWLVNYFETLLVQAWYPITVATNSYHQKLVIDRYMRETADSLDKVPFMLHDFGYRGSTSDESAGIGGAAHLVNFKGTDTLRGIITAAEYYGPSDLMAGFSVPATEHSTMTSWGRDGEKEAVEHLMGEIPEGPLSIVSDSYNIWTMLDEVFGGDLKERVERREGGPIIVRPDSGDPPTMVVKVLAILGDKFGTSRNGKGFKILPHYIRVIQGDGIDLQSLEEILKAMKDSDWSADNLVFGSGGGLLQKVNRDTMKCAYKCSQVIIDGKEVDVFKEPITDKGKTSKKGKLLLVKQDGEFKTIKESEKGPEQDDELVVVFENGKMVTEWTFEEVRKMAQLRPQKE